MSTELASILIECSVVKPLVDFLVSIKDFKVEDFVWAAQTDKSKIDDEIIVASGISGLTFDDKIGIRKAWWMAELAMNNKAALASSLRAADANAPISADDSKNLHEAWLRRRNFTMMSRRLLSDTQQRQLLREDKNKPKTFLVILPQTLRVRGVVAQAPLDTTLTFVPGQSATAAEVFTEAVGDSIELWRRIRALCGTLAFISVQNPLWLDFETADEFADKCLDWMNTKYDGRRPPLSFFIQAYVSPFTMFFEMIHASDVTMLSLMKTSLPTSVFGLRSLGHM